MAKEDGRAAEIDSANVIALMTKNNDVIHAEGLSAAELAKFLEQAQSITAVDTSKSPPP